MPERAGEELRFSVIMPVWNRADFVGAAVESVLAQTETDWELLIVDDGSTDDLATALTPYRDHPSIHVFATTHAGVCAARNRGLQEARGEWITYLDSDNRWRPRFLERMGAALEGSHAVAAYSDFQLWRRSRLNGSLKRSRPKSEPFDYSSLVRRPYIDINTFIHHSRVSDEVGEWDEAIDRMNDWDFILRVTARHEPIHVAEVLVDYYYCVAGNTITRTQPPRPSGLRVMEKFASFARPAITHDAITYTWNALPPRKHYNWVRYMHHAVDRETFRASCFPSVMQVEVTNLCNLTCPLCPAGRDELERPRRNMTLEEFRGIVDDLEDYLMLLILWDWGEPLMNPSLPEMVAYATARDIRTVTSTNAQFLDDEHYLERLLTSGLSSLIVAIDSLSEEGYGLYRQRGSLRKAFEGLHRLVALKRRLGSDTLINVRTVVMQHNEDELPALREAARAAGADCFTLKNLNPSCGPFSSDESMVPANPAYQRFEYEPGTYRRIPSDAHCERVWMMANILADGSVVPCCYDYDATMKVGNAFEKPFTEIWHSPEYRELRRRILLDKQKIQHCRECHASFKQTGGGWVFERTDFNMPWHSTFRYKLSALARYETVRRAVRAASGLGW